MVHRCGGARQRQAAGRALPPPLPGQARSTFLFIARAKARPPTCCPAVRMEERLESPATRHGEVRRPRVVFMPSMPPAQDRCLECHAVPQRVSADAPFMLRTNPKLCRTPSLSRTTPASALSTCCRSTGALASCSCSWGFDVLAWKCWPAGAGLKCALGEQQQCSRAGLSCHAMLAVHGTPKQHRPSRFPSTYSLYRNTFPAALWEKIEGLFPARRRSRPVCVDIAIGAEGRGGVELARRQALVLIQCALGPLKRGWAGWG